MGCKCALCGVPIKKQDLAICACGKKYHMSSCAKQAAGKSAGVIDACCGDKRTTRGEGLGHTSQDKLEAGSTSESESDSDDSYYQSPNQHPRQGSPILDRIITCTTTSPSISIISSPTGSIITSPTFCLSSTVTSCQADESTQGKLLVPARMSLTPTNASSPTMHNSSTVAMSISMPITSPSVLTYGSLFSATSQPLGRNKSLTTSSVATDAGQALSDASNECIASIQEKLDLLINVCGSITKDVQFHKQQFEKYQQFQISQNSKYENIHTKLVDALATFDKRLENTDSKTNKLIEQINNSIDPRVSKLEQQFASIIASSSGPVENPSSVNNVDSQSWRQEVVVFGIPYNNNENLTMTTQALCKFINFNDTTLITLTSRLGSDRSSNRPIRIRFSSATNCIAFLEARRKKGKILLSDLDSSPDLEARPRSILVYKRSPLHLTQLRKDILIRHPNCMPKDVWLGNNKVFVRVNGTIVSLKDRFDLYKLPTPSATVKSSRRKPNAPRHAGNLDGQ